MTQEKVKAQMEEMKRKRMLEDYNHQITHRADKLPITKISYRINSSKEALIRITKDNDPLNLTVNDKFKLKSLGFSEWLEAKTLVIPPPPELSNFGIQVDDKKEKEAQRSLRGLVITEPDAEIFYYNGNFNLDFHRESEFHLAITAQLIKILDDFQGNTPEAEEMYKRLQLAIEARDDLS
nr:hypothetical protein [Tanacetum cinerariifolium]